MSSNANVRGPRSYPDGTRLGSQRDYLDSMRLDVWLGMTFFDDFPQKSTEEKDGDECFHASKYMTASRSQKPSQTVPAVRKVFASDKIA